MKFQRSVPSCNITSLQPFVSLRVVQAAIVKADHEGWDCEIFSNQTWPPDQPSVKRRRCELPLPCRRSRCKETRVEFEMVFRIHVTYWHIYHYREFISALLPPIVAVKPTICGSKIISISEKKIARIEFFFVVSNIENYN